MCVGQPAIWTVVEPIVKRSFRGNREKPSRWLASLDADIVAIVELENNASESLRSIVDGLNAVFGADTYDFVDTGTIGSDAIKVGFVFRPADVQLVGPYALLDSSVDARFNDRRHRPVLAQTFRCVASGGQLTVVATIISSPRVPAAPATAIRKLVMARAIAAQRVMQAAAAMIDWIASDPTSSGDTDYLIVGDFNTHAMGDAVMSFKSAGFVSVLPTHFIGADAYSFEFDGQLGALDHALASRSLAAKVVDAAEWHINADEARLNDYNLEFGRDPALFDPTNPYRASDHDPLIVGIEF